MNPVSRKELVKRLRQLGFEGPFQGSKHAFMRRGSLKLRIPNEHGSDIGPDLLSVILKEAHITKEEWEALE